MSFLRRCRLFGAVGWVVAAFLVPAAAETETRAERVGGPRLPSVILIIADGLGYGELGCYGQAGVATPRIDALAAAGIRFTDAYAGGASEMAARAALLSGVFQDSGLSRDVPTLAEQLKSAGYHTAYIGEWGLGAFASANAPHRRGFDEVIVYGDRGHAHNLHTGSIFRKDPHTGYEGRMMLAGNPPGRETAYLPDLLTGAAVKFCGQNKPERLNRFRPFLLVVGYPVPAAADDPGDRVPPNPLNVGQGWSDAELARANSLSRLDQHVGEILDELDGRGMIDNTIVVVTSSLGPEPSAAGRDDSDITSPFSLRNGALSEGRLRVPLIVSWPFWGGGRTSDLLVSSVDFCPTLMAAARMDPPEPSPGISFLPCLQGRDQTNRHAFLSWSVPDPAGGQQQAVRQGEWKAILPAADQPWLLFNLQSDPGERSNRALAEPQKVKDLTGLLQGDKPPGRKPVASPATDGSPGGGSS